MVFVYKKLIKNPITTLNQEILVEEIDFEDIIIGIIDKVNF